MGDATAKEGWWARHFPSAKRRNEKLKAEILAGVRSEVQRVHDLVNELNIGTRRNLQFAMDHESIAQSATLARAEMLKARTFPHPVATLEYALSLAPSGGLTLEFGVFSGSTLRVIAQARGGRRVYGFDSFQGLPEAWRSGFPEGAFAVPTKPDVPGAELVVGWFDDSLPPFLAAHSGAVDFLHVDCDLYSSTRTIFEHVGPRLKAGSVVLFDEFFNYPGWQEHEYKAWMEWVRRTGTEFVYEAYTFNNEQVAARITSAPAHAAGA